MDNSISIMTAGGNSPVTMSSRDIAELVEKRHDHVMRDIENQLSSLGFDLPKFGGIYIDERNREQRCYHLPKDLTLTVVSGYDVHLRYRVVKKLEEMEAASRAPTIPRTMVEALRLAADAIERAELAERTKAEIGNRREATAMNTASQAVKRANKLELELDRSQSYATIKRMSMLYHGQEFSWRMLKHVSAEMGSPPIDVFDANYGTVKAYHASVWREAYALEIPSLAESERAA